MRAGLPATPRTRWPGMLNNPDPPGRIMVVDDDATLTDVVGRYL
jgi:hypothetical protein